MSVNVNRDVDDAFYRYKMPKILSKIEGKGNGIKTVIPNMVEVSKALGRPPEYPTKYFGCELGSQTTMDAKNARYIVNGSHDANKLAELLDGFIKKFVLCSACKNPETVMILKGKDNDIYLSCKACGKVAKADNTHKLCNFIRNNPPPNSSEASDAKKDKATTDSKTDAAPISSSKSVDSKRTKSDDATSSTSTEVAEPANNNKGQDDAIEEFVTYLGLDNHSAAEIALEASKLDIDEERMGLIVVQVLLGENIMTQFSKYKVLLADLAKSVKVQKGFIGGIERIVGVTKPDLLPKLNGLLKGCYDNEILEEETIIQWHEKLTKKYTGDKDIAAKVRQTANPFIEWIKNAEEDEED